MANNTVHTITLSGYTAATGGNCWALQLGTWDSYGIEQIQLKLDQEWDGLVITATFTPPKGRKAVKVVVDSSGLFDVPQEATALSGQGAITFAGNTSGQQRISVDVPYVVANHAAVDGVTPDPTPSEWEQFVAQVQQARDDAEAAAQAAEGSNTAAAGSASAAAESAQEAQNIVDGAVQDITDAKNAAVQAVNDAGNTAVQAVQAAQTAAVGAVNAAGDAKIEQIEQINALVPTPTPEDAGKVVVVKPDGTGYELGDAGSEIDDTVVAPDSTWSSLNIVNKLCPPFSVMGDVVQFAPIEGYPLSVQSTIVATQEGTGDPSPTNVRPIVPVDEVGVWVGGKNMLDANEMVGKAFPSYAELSVKLPAATLTASIDTTGGTENGFTATFYNSAGNIKSVAVRGSQTFELTQEEADAIQGVKIYAFTGSVGAILNGLQIEAGATATDYEPYRGQLYTAPLPEPRYGGTVDLTGGTGEVTALCETLLAENVTGYGTDQYGRANFTVNLAVRTPILKTPTISNILPYKLGSGDLEHFYQAYASGAVLVHIDKSRLSEDSLEGAKTFISQANMQVLYYLSTPTTLTITPLEIPAPASPATAYSTAGEITVEGRSDPTALIQQMQEQIAALQSATIGG